MAYKTFVIFSVRKFISTKCYYWFDYRIVKESQVAFRVIFCGSISLHFCREVDLYLFSRSQ